jgi:hypothetical protein
MIMKNRRMYQLIAAGLAVLLTMGCSISTTVPTPVSPTPTPIPPTVTPESPSILGTITGPDEGEPIGPPYGPLAGAQVYLRIYQDEECVNLANSTTELSEQEKEQLEDCMHETMTTSDEKGQYRFSNVSPGWYRLMIEWELDGAPNIDPDVLFQIRHGFFVVTFETDETPKKHFARALQEEIFYFPGSENLVIDFDYCGKD